MVPRKQSKFVKDAIFLSNTSLNDFLSCPRAYYLKNIYRDPRNNYRIQIASPYLALGATVHDVIKWYLTCEEVPTLEGAKQKFKDLWGKYHGRRGGFTSAADETDFVNRGMKILENFVANAKRLEKPAPPAHFPKYPLLEDVILTGNMDFVGLLPDGSLHVVDFKTGSKDEDSPLQLYIYAILAENYYGKPVKKASFWYLDRDDAPKEAVLDSVEQNLEWLIDKSRQVKEAWGTDCWECIKGENPCRDCLDYQAILDGKGEFVYTDHTFKKEVYFLSAEKKISNL